MTKKEQDRLLLAAKQAREDILAGRFVSETAEEHIKRIRKKVSWAESHPIENPIFTPILEKIHTLCLRLLDSVRKRKSS